MAELNDDGPVIGIHVLTAQVLAEHRLGPLLIVHRKQKADDIQRPSRGHAKPRLVAIEELIGDRPVGRVAVEPRKAVVLNASTAAADAASGSLNVHQVSRRIGRSCRSDAASGSRTR